VTKPNLVMAEGLATGSGFELPLSIMGEPLDGFVLVDDGAIGDAMLEEPHLLVEPAGASSLANRKRLAGCRVVLVCPRANITRAQLQALLNERETSSAR